MGWLGSWKFRRSLTIDQTLVDGDLSDFPVLVKLSAASGIGDVDVSGIFDELTSDANRLKIAVTTSDGTTQCYVEIESWSTASELAWLHVKVPAVSGALDTVLYIYYDASQADNTDYVGDVQGTPAKSVWDSSTKARFGLSQDPTGGSGCIKDSTANANHGTPAGSMTSGDLVSSPPGFGLDFDGVDDCVALGNPATLQLNDPFTLEVVFTKSADPVSYPNLIGHGTNGWSLGFSNEAGNVGKVFMAKSGSAPYLNSTTIPANGTAYSVAVVRSGANTEIFINGGSEGSSALSPTFTFANGLSIARDNSGGGKYQGIITEVRISNVARSAAWIKASHHGWFDSLITYGLQETRVFAHEMTSFTVMDQPTIIGPVMAHEMTSLTVMDQPVLASPVNQYSMFLVM